MQFQGSRTLQSGRNWQNDPVNSHSGGADVLAVPRVLSEVALLRRSHRILLAR